MLGYFYTLFIHLFPFMLYVVIGGSVAQFRYRLMLHASLIIAWLNEFCGGSVERSSNRFMLHASLMTCIYWSFG